MSSSPAPSTISPSPSATPHDDTAAFCSALFDYAPSELHTMLWTLQDRRSTWLPLSSLNGPADVAAMARQLAQRERDVYVAVSLSRTSGMHDTRIKSANAAGIMGLWADIDIADPDVHKKWNLPPTIDDALGLLGDAGAEPTLVVHSGHGLQAWWLFKEFWDFDTEQARLEAAGLAQRWNTTLQARAAEKQWVVDSTFDLARVMRMPGTLNRKGSPVVPVRLLKADGPRWTPDELEPFCVDAAYLSRRGLSPSRSYVPDEFEISDTLAPPFERLQALVDNDSVFEATWKHQRSVKEMPDQSPSSYDMSLANQAVAAGWSDEEIAGLILHFRRRHKLDVSKAMRRDYIVRTIAKARDGLARDQSTEALEEVTDELADAKASGDDEQIRSARRGAYDAVGQQLGIEVLHFIKYLSDPPSFALATPTGLIPLGGADGILQWSKFRQSVWENIGVQIPRFKTGEWDRITEVIPAAWEEQDVGAEATERGEVTSWLVQYLSQRPPLKNLEDAARSEYPFWHNGLVTIFGPAFKRWLYITYQERISAKELGRRLKVVDCESASVNVPDPQGKRTSRGVWRLPKVLADAAGVVPDDE